MSKQHDKVGHNSETGYKQPSSSCELKYSILANKIIETCSCTVSSILHKEIRYLVNARFRMWKQRFECRQMPMMYQTSNVFLALLANNSSVWTGCSIFFIWQLTDTVWGSKESKKIKTKLTRFEICLTRFDWFPAPQPAFEMHISKYMYFCDCFYSGEANNKWHVLNSLEIVNISLRTV